MQPQDFAGQASVHRLDTNELSYVEPITLQRWVEILVVRIEEKVFAYLQNILIEPEFLLHILFFGRARGQFRNELRAFRFFPDEVVVTIVLRDAAHHKDIGGHMASAISRLKKDKQVAGNIEAARQQTEAENARLRRQLEALQRRLREAP